MKETRVKELIFISREGRFCKELHEVGVRIAYYRRRRDLSQEALAEAAGISKSYLSKIERADVKGLSLITLLDIAGALHVQIEELLKFDGRI